MMPMIARSKQPRIKHLRKLHAIGKKRGLAHEDLRALLNLTSLKAAGPELLEAACRLLAADSLTSLKNAWDRAGGFRFQLKDLKDRCKTWLPQGGQHQAPAPRESNRNRRRPPRMPPKAKALGMCMGCFMPSQSNPCPSCKAQGQPPTQPPQDAPAVLAMGPLPMPTQPVQIDEPTIDRPGLTIDQIEHLDLVAALHSGATKVTPSYRRVEFEGRMTEVAQRSIIRWMEQHGATGSNPFNRTLRSGDLTLRITCRGWGSETTIELVDETPASAITTQHSAMLLACGGAR